MLFFTSCNGQNKAQPQQTVSDVKTTPKLIKSHSSTIYDNVGCGIQDKAGNLWFGTAKDGVYRYDGKSFTNFTVKDGLSRNTICSILEDKTGNIWFGTDSGMVCRYVGSRANHPCILKTCKHDLRIQQDLQEHNKELAKTFTNIPIAVTNNSNLYRYETPTNNPSKKNSVNSILQDKSGNIWFGTYDGVYCYNGMFFTRFLDNDSIINKNHLTLRCVQSIKEDKAGNIWFTTWFEGVCRYDGKSLTNFKPNDEVWFRGLLADKQGNIWAGRRGNGVCRYDGKAFSNVLQNGVFDSCVITVIIEDKAGNIWFGTEHGDITKREISGGLWKYDGKTFKNFTTKDGLSHIAVFCIVEDKTGNIWVGTRNTGLCRYDGKTFTKFSE
ncbi:MAG: two-component regulator propeller domain-containing protein [Bacteroidia bacterium]